jgi:hypothetical protein
MLRVGYGAIRDSYRRVSPDFASLHPGYEFPSRCDRQALRAISPPSTGITVPMRNDAARQSQEEQGNDAGSVLASLPKR